MAGSTNSPKCRKDYTMDEEPRSYLCYCGKVTNPTFVRE